MTEQNTLSISELQQQANAGDALAQLGLACYYNYLLFFDLNNKEKFSALRTIVSPENINEALAFEWLKKAVEQGCAEAQYLLARCYFNGQGVGRNSVLGIEWLKKAAEQGNAEAQCYLSNLHIQGFYIELNDALAFECLEKAAERGVAEAQYRLALCYFEGKGVEQNDELAFTCFKNAFEQGSTELTKNNEILAFECFKKTAGQGITEVEYRLAHCYFEGKGVEKNYQFGMKWMISAAKKGHVVANNWLTNAYLSLAIPSCLSDKEDAEQYYEFAAEWCLKDVDGHNAAEAYLLLGVLYSSGKGVEQSDERALDYFKKADEAIMRVANGEDYQSIQSFIDCYLLCKGESRYECLSYSFYDIVGDAFVEGILKVAYRENPNHKAFLTLLRAAIYKEAGEYGLAKDCIKEAFDKDEYMDKNLRDICLANIEQEQKLDEINQELEAKNKQLQEAQKELEDMMSMFAHKFRSPLDAIIYNTTHENQVKLYTEAAQTMRGLLDIFSNISTDADILKDKIKQDKQGRGGLTSMFSKTLDMILLHFLSKEGATKIQQHYIVYAKAHDLCVPQLSYKQWDEDYLELELQLQAEWEQSYAQLLIESAPLEQRLAWLEQHFFKLEVRGFNSANIHFKEYGTTESFLTILLNEILVNAFKYYSSMDKQPVVLEWTELDGYQVLSCRNPSVRSERSMLKGSGKGHAFLSALARKTDSQFSKPMPQDDFVLEFGIANELLTANPEGEL